MQHKPDWPKVLYQFKKHAGKPFMPSNGTEGVEFTCAWCETCIHQHPDPERKPVCDDILLESLIGNQPTEWIFSNEGWPVCTAYKKWDWGNDNDGWNIPPDPNPINPRQLEMPFDLIRARIVGCDDFIVLPTAIIERELIHN